VNSLFFHQLWDRFSIGISLLCVVHCLGVPLVLSVYPAALATSLLSEEFHQMLLWLVLPSSAVAVQFGCWRHRDWLVLAGAVAGLSVLVVAAGLEGQLLSGVGETLVTLLGSALLVASHLRNFSLCRHCDCSHQVGSLEDGKRLVSRGSAGAGDFCGKLRAFSKRAQSPCTVPSAAQTKPKS